LSETRPYGQATEEEVDSELSLFDKIKLINQNDSTCTTIRNAIRKRKKFFEKMLLKKFELIENILVFKKKL
jgi:hypothetical protein